jgi:chemotaxis protein methyltransferase CheR
MIYFDIESKKKVVKHIYDKINNNGYLFIGYTEILTGISDDFKLVRFPNATAYLKE